MYYILIKDYILFISLKGKNILSFSMNKMHKIYFNVFNIALKRNIILKEH